MLLFLIYGYIRFSFLFLKAWILHSSHICIGELYMSIGSGNVSDRMHEENESMGSS